MAGIRDVYMNVFPLEVTFGADASLLVSANHNTSAGPSSKQAWRIHAIEWMWQGVRGAYNRTEFVISTRKNLAALPQITDMGSVAKLQKKCASAGAAFLYIDTQPFVQTFLPPMIIAASNLTLYAKSSAADAQANSTKVEARLLYTMVDLTSDIYSELFQTWNFAN